MSPRVLAIIPARGGSKGILGKNIRNICKLSLAWTIEAALNSNSLLPQLSQQMMKELQK